MTKFEFTIAIIGDVKTGKTSLIKRFTENTFRNESCQSTILDFKTSSIEIECDCCTLHIWDTGGQERFRSMPRSYYRKADAFVVVYDITFPKSLENVQDWLTDIEDNAQPDVPIYLVGNKCDKTLKRSVSKTTGEIYATQKNLEFMETSAKSSDNVNELFRTITVKLRADRIKTMPQKCLAIAAPTRNEEPFHVRNETTATKAPQTSLCC